MHILTCALLQASNTAQVDGPLHEGAVRVLNAACVDILLVLAALGKVLKVDCSAGRAWDHVHSVVLAAGRHLEVGWSRTLGMEKARHYVSLGLKAENYVSCGRAERRDAQVALQMPVLLTKP
jgi:hypothetical protein